MCSRPALANAGFAKVSTRYGSISSAVTLPSGGMTSAMASVVVAVNIPTSSTSRACVTAASMRTNAPSRPPAHISRLSGNCVFFCAYAPAQSCVSLFVTRLATASDGGVLIAVMYGSRPATTRSASATCFLISATSSSASAFRSSSATSSIGVSGTPGGLLRIAASTANRPSAEVTGPPSGSCASRVFVVDGCAREVSAPLRPRGDAFALVVPS